MDGATGGSPPAAARVSASAVIRSRELSFGITWRSWRMEANSS